MLVLCLRLVAAAACIGHWDVIDVLNADRGRYADALISYNLMGANVQYSCMHTVLQQTPSASQSSLCTGCCRRTASVAMTTAMTVHDVVVLNV